jgi:5'(3')-deoxyribonucleotidase
MAQSKFVLGVDLDGVVADFYEGLRPIAAEWLGVPESSLTRDVSYGLPEWRLERMGASSQESYERLHRFAVTQRDLFRKLDPIGSSAATLRRLSALDDVRIRIITHRLYIKYFHQQALSQTVEWLEHYGIPYWDLCFMKEKDAVGADLYIEDSPTNVEALRAAQCDVIVFGNSTNKHVAGPRVTSWDELEILARDRVAEWRGDQSEEKSGVAFERPNAELAVGT